MLFNKKDKHHIPAEFRRKPFHQRLPEIIDHQTNATLKFLSGPFNRKRASYPRKSFNQRLNEWMDAQLRAVIRVVIRVQRGSKTWRLRVPVWLLIPVAFAVGTWLTFIIMKQRHAASDVIVVVKGVPISQPQFFHRMEIEIGPQVLNKMIEEEITMQFAQQRNAMPTQAAVKARIKQFQQQPGFDDYAKLRHWKLEDLEQQSRVQLAQENLYGKNVTITDEDALAYYRSQSDPHNPKSLFYIPETARLAVIITSTEGAALKAQQELQQGKIFASVAKTYSQDRTGVESGGEMPLAIKGRTQLASDPAFEQACFQLKPGDRTGPRKFLNLWWIVECKERNAAYTIPFETVKEQCRHTAQVQKAANTNAAQVEADFEQFRKKANVQVFWEQYYYDLTGQQPRLPGARK